MKVSDTYVRNAKMVRVVDGDTVELNVDLGCDITVNMSCRLDGLNAPEKNTPEGKVSMKFMQDTFPEGTDLVIKTIKDKKEKYGRYLAILYTPDSDVSVNDEMITKGLAKPWNGKGVRPV